MLFIKTIFSYVKKYWKYAVAIIISLIAIFLFRKKSFDFSKQLKMISDNHEEELRKIAVAREEERILREQNEERLQTALLEVTQQYEKAKKDLDTKKKKEIEDIVKRYSNNPEQLAKKLSETTGFTIILPND